MKKISFIGLLLVTALLLSLFAACKDNTEPPEGESSIAVTESSEVIEESSEVPSEPERIDGTEPYNNALDAFEEHENIKSVVEYESTRNVGTHSFTETAKIEETYIGYGKKDMAVQSKSEYIYGDIKTVNLVETYVGGYRYCDMGEYLYKSDEEFDSEINLLDPELYGEITVLPDPNENGETVITFTQPTAVEDWAAYSYAELYEAYGEVMLDADGNIVSFTYRATYLLGGVEYTYSQSSAFEVLDEASLPEITAPEKADDYKTVSSVTAVLLFDEVRMHLEALEVYSSSRSSFFLSDGIGAYEQSYSDVDYFDYNDTYVYKNELMKYNETYNPYKNDWDVVDIVTTTEIIDGEKTFTNGNNTNTSTMTKEELKQQKESAAESFLDYVPEFSDIKDISYEVFDGYVVITVIGNAAFDIELRKSVCDYLCGDEDFLDDNTDSYKNKTLEFTITADIDSHLPVATSIVYNGIHTLNGYEYELAFESECVITPANPDVYYNVTEEHYPELEQEPEDDEVATPLFYKVTDNEGNVMWLLGTIHIGDNLTAYLPDEIYEAFDSSDAAAFEINALDIYEQLENNEKFKEEYSKMHYYDDGKTAFDYLDEDLAYLLEKRALILGYGSHGEYLKGMYHTAKIHTWDSLIGQTYSDHSSSLSGNKGVDMRLMERAEELGIKIYDIEDRMEHMAIFDNYSTEIQSYLIESTLRSPRTYYIYESLYMYDLWCSGDYDEAYEYINTEPDFSLSSENEIKAYEEYYKKMNTDRDLEMLEKAKEYLASGETVFFAVGMAHLLEKDTGLVKTLEEAGYTVELVEYK